jgi:hypothetical protein
MVLFGERLTKLKENKNSFIEKSRGEAGKSSCPDNLYNSMSSIRQI